MHTNSKNFDVCLVFFTALMRDARTLNLARTLARNNISVCVIAHGSDAEAAELAKENIVFFPVRQNASDRFRTKWAQFTAGARKYRSRASASVYIACDLYVLYVANRLSIIHKAKLFYDSREIYSALGPLSKNPVKQMVISSMERRLIHNASEIIVSGSQDADYIYNLYKLKNRPKVIMNLPPFRPLVQSSLLRDTFNIGPDKTILLYQGVLLPGRGLLPVVRSLVFYEEAVFCIIGEGIMKDMIIDQAKALNVQDRVIFCGTVDYDDLHQWTCSADIGVSFIEPVSFSYVLALPNKLFECCMAGIPSLVSDLPAMHQVIQEHPIGRLVPPDSSPETIAHAFKDIQRDRDKYLQACRLAAVSFSYESQEPLIIEMVRKYL